MTVTGSAYAMFLELPDNWQEIIKAEFREGKSMVEAHLALGLSAS